LFKVHPAPDFQQGLSVLVAISNLKHGPAVRTARRAIAYLDASAVKIEDSFHDGQAQTCSLVRRFRGEEWLEDLAEHL
jgi:hypothetical protein